jgi:hypothetical protein
MKNNTACHLQKISQGYLRNIFRFILLIHVAFVAAIVGTSVESIAAVEIPSPSWLARTHVADNMVINGLPSVVHYFETDRKLEELLDFYRQRWDESAVKKAGYREAEVGPWHVISKIDGQYLLTVQAQQKDAFTTKGYLATGDLSAVQNKKDQGEGVPKMSGSKIVNDLVSNDPGKKGRTMMIANGFSVSGNTDYYRNYYLSRGWGQLMDQGSNEAQVLAFSRFGKEAHLVISKTTGGSTMVVMNLIEND